MIARLNKQPLHKLLDINELDVKQSISKESNERRDLPLGVGKKRIKNNAELNKLTD